VEATDARQLLRRACTTLEGYYELGCEVVEDQLVGFVRNPAAPQVYDANQATRVRAATDAEIDVVIARADEVFAGLSHRQFRCDSWTPSGFEARLALDGYECEPELQLLLEGDLRLTREPPPVDIRRVESDDDWASLRRLTRLDHEEETAKAARPLWSEDVTAQMVATKRMKAPALRFWVASAGGVDCAFLSSWPGVDGVGMVEDLFTHREHRRRGIATALIARCVDDTRARGAGPVLIGALVNDTPKHMYAALGFRPYCVTRAYRRIM
jgi:GNAT superfamily N-acetyltransferase